MPITNEAEVVAVDMDARKVFLMSGERCPITNMIDDRGNETDDPDDAVSVVFPIASIDKWGCCEV